MDRIFRNAGDRDACFAALWMMVAKDDRGSRCRPESRFPFSLMR